MKRLYWTIAACIMLAAGSCGKDDRPGKDSGYDADFELDAARVTGVTDLGGGVSGIEVEFTSQTYLMTLCFGTREAFLEPAAFSYSPSAGEGRFSASLKALGKNMPLGADTKLSMTKSPRGTYDITLTSTVEGSRVRGHYSGIIRMKGRIEAGNMKGVGGMVFDDETIDSRILGQEMLYTAFVPRSWDGKKKFPVLYLLHGMENTGMGNNKWNTDGKFSDKLSAAILSGAAAEMVVILPNCAINGTNYFYCNDYVPGARYMDYFFEEFVPHVENLFCIDGSRGSRMIAGLSMGGYGSLYYGSLHPEMFSHVYACSPATFGGPSIYELYSSDLEAGKEIPGITIEIGTEDYLYDSAGVFEAFLTSKGIAHDYITRPGVHDWNFWTVCADKIIAKATELFR